MKGRRYRLSKRQARRLRSYHDYLLFSLFSPPRVRSLRWDEDGRINAVDPDSDGVRTIGDPPRPGSCRCRDDNLYDGLERGYTPGKETAGTDLARGYFVPDTDHCTTDPYDSDSDNDGIDDGVEDQNHNGKIEGDNGDGIYQTTESWSETSPNLIDSDGDTFTDGQEKGWGYNPLSKDTDGDGLDDNIEDSSNYGTKDASETSAKLSDTDGDGLSDKMESEGWTVLIIYENTYEIIEEYTVTSNPLVPDADGDGIKDGGEFENGTDPDKKDTDGDGKEDKEEIDYKYGSSPTGIRGSPPEITDFQPSYELETETSGSLWNLKIIVEYKVNIKVSASDMFGISWIKVNLNGVGEKTIMCDESIEVKDMEFSFTLDSTQAVNSLFNSFGTNTSAENTYHDGGYIQYTIPNLANYIKDGFIGSMNSIKTYITDNTINIILDKLDVFIINRLKPYIMNYDNTEVLYNNLNKIISIVFHVYNKLKSFINNCENIINAYFESCFELSLNKLNIFNNFNYNEFQFKDIFSSASKEFINTIELLFYLMLSSFFPGLKIKMRNYLSEKYELPEGSEIQLSEINFKDVVKYSSNDKYQQQNVDNSVEESFSNTNKFLLILPTGDRFGRVESRLFKDIFEDHGWKVITMASENDYMNYNNFYKYFNEIKLNLENNEGGQVVIYYGGHGIKTDGMYGLQLGYKDYFTTQPDIIGFAIRDYLYDENKNPYFDNLVIIFDSCFSRDILYDQINRELLMANLDLSKVTYIGSTDSGKKGIYNSAANCIYFSTFFLSGLNTEKTNKMYSIISDLWMWRFSNFVYYAILPYAHFFDWTGKELKETWNDLNFINFFVLLFYGLLWVVSLLTYIIMGIISIIIGFVWSLVEAFYFFFSKSYSNLYDAYNFAYDKSREPTCLLFRSMGDRCSPWVMNINLLKEVEM